MRVITWNLNSRTNKKDLTEQCDYLRKGDGKLASNYHGETNFAMKRQQKVVDEQFEREELHRKNNKK